jgi:hypothetical protein
MQPAQCFRQTRDTARQQIESNSVSIERASELAKKCAPQFKSFPSLFVEFTNIRAEIDRQTGKQIDRWDRPPSGFLAQQNREATLPTR